MRGASRRSGPLKATDHDVYLYEAAGQLGGHVNTVDFRKGKYTTRVDTGFIVLNTATYRESGPSSSPLPRIPPPQRSQD